MSREPGQYAVRVGVEWIEADFDGHEYTCASGPIDEVGPRLDGDGWLTSLIGEQQARALESAADECVPAMHHMAHWLRARAADIRRQAQGKESTQ